MLGRSSASSLPGVVGGGQRSRMSVVGAPSSSSVRRGGPPLESRLKAYSISLSASVQRSAEEERVKAKMQQRQARQQAKEREQLRERVVMLALQEAQQAERPGDLSKMLDEQRRFLASKNVEHADERYYTVRADPYRRFYQPTPDEVEYREAEFRRRRDVHRMQRGARVAMIDANVEARASSIAQASDARLRGAKERHAHRLQAIASHNTASAPALLKTAPLPSTKTHEFDGGEPLNMFAPPPDMALVARHGKPSADDEPSADEAGDEVDEGEDDDALSPSRQTRLVQSVVYGE